MRLSRPRAGGTAALGPGRTELSPRLHPPPDLRPADSHVPAVDRHHDRGLPPVDSLQPKLIERAVPQGGEAGVRAVAPALRRGKQGPPTLEPASAGDRNRADGSLSPARAGSRDGRGSPFPRLKTGATVLTPGSAGGRLTAPVPLSDLSGTPGLDPIGCDLEVGRS